MERDLSPKIKARFFVKWLLIAVSLVVLYLLAFTYLIDKRPFVEWTLIKSEPTETVAQAQLIKMPGGEVILINAGDASGSLLLFLKKQKIKDVDKLILSSNFNDSISGIDGLIKAGIRLKEVLFNPASGSTPIWENIQTTLKNKGITVRPVQSQEIFYQKGITRLSSVSATPNLFAVKLIHGANKVLLVLGDGNSLKTGSSFLGCEQFPVDILLNYSRNLPQIKTWESCSSSAVDLAKERGTFKILLKGDSYRWKRGR